MGLGKRDERRTDGVEVDLSLQAGISDEVDDPLLSLLPGQVQTSREVAEDTTHRGQQSNAPAKPTNGDKRLK